jgi:hypothetical protein
MTVWKPSDPTSTQHVAKQTGVPIATLQQMAANLSTPTFKDTP